MNFHYAGLLRAFSGESALIAGALIVLAFDLAFARRLTPARRLNAASAFGILALGTAAALFLFVGNAGPLLGGTVVLDPLALATRVGVLVLGALTAGLAFATSRLRNPAEYIALILFATSGFTLMAAAQQLLLVFLAIELASLSLYVLAGFDKSSPASAEAALKYFLVGGMSSAFLLFGFSLLYGLTGSIELPQIAASLGPQAMTPLLAVALVMVLVGFGFKAAAAPFHLWAPDVYQGAPAPSAALVASASKLAGLAVFIRLLWPGLGPVAGNPSFDLHAPGWLAIAAVLSGASLLAGNIGALAQTNLRRLFAYSAIAHAGIMLLGVMAAGSSGLAPVFYFSATYGIATVGIFGVIAVLEHAGNGGLIADLAGLHRRSPLLTVCLFIFVLSLAGIPPLAGFFGKFFVFAAALKSNGLAGASGWLACAAIAASAVALYYYLVVLKSALVTPPAQHAPPIKVPFVAALCLILAAGLIVALGLFPSALLNVFAGTPVTFR